MSTFPLGILAQPKFVPFTATGGTITDANGWRYHTLTSSTTFSVTSGSLPAGKAVALHVGAGGNGSYGSGAYLQAYGGAGGTGGGYASYTVGALNAGSSYSLTVPSSYGNPLINTLPVSGPIHGVNETGNSWLGIASGASGAYAFYNDWYGYGGSTNANNGYYGPFYQNMTYLKNAANAIAPNFTNYLDTIGDGKIGDAGAGGGASVYGYFFGYPGYGTGYSGDGGSWGENGKNALASYGAGGGGGGSSNNGGGAVLTDIGAGGSGRIVIAYPLSYVTG